MAKSSEKSHPRIPPEVDGIQVNHCKNPLCQNFGVPALESRWRVPSGIGSYQLAGSGKDSPVLICHICRRATVLYGNLSISQEAARLDPINLRSQGASCPNEECSSFGLSVGQHADLYYQHGKTRAGQPRFRCKECGQTFSCGPSIRKQRRPELNQEVLRMIVNKVPMRRICEVLELNPATLYSKLSYLAEAAIQHASVHEERLLSESFRLRRAYISADRQDYLLNWGTQLDRRYTTLGAIGAVENTTGYILALELNFDPNCNPQDVEANAIFAGDYEVPRAYRRYGRLWLRKDYEKKSDADQVETIRPIDESKPPTLGMQVHLGDMQYGVFFHLRRLLQRVEKIRFFLDGDPGLDSACLAAFVDRVKSGEVDVFVVHGQGKDLTVDKKKLQVAHANRELEKFAQRAGLTDMSQAKHAYVAHRLEHHLASERASEPFSYPLADMAEPNKAIMHLTKNRDCELDHLARLYMKATLRGVDRVFMQIRRRLSILERPLVTTNSARRTWHGYAAYSPIVVQQVLRIFRAYYNYALVGEDGKTPAMRLGLAEAPIPIAALAELPAA